MTAASRLSAEQKALGAYYTDPAIAEFLVWWAVRSGGETVLDPSFGGGVFLSAACRRVAELGGEPSRQVFGVEVDPAEHARTLDELSEKVGISRSNLLLSSFFDIQPGSDRSFDVVVGNPPFIRYQRFNGETRKRALACAAAEGVRLTELCSSWAPFLVHSVAMLREGGRLAMVVPAEIGHAAYARPVIEHLSKSFAKVTFLTFRKKLFPDLSEHTLLLLAEDRSSGTAEFFLRDFSDAGVLTEMMSRGHFLLSRALRVDAEAMGQGDERLVGQLIPKKARELYRKMRGLPIVRRLGQLCDVGIGYVTGANDFFHLDPESAKLWGIPDEFLQPAVLRGRALRGLRFTRRDWQHALDSGDARYLLRIAPGRELPDAVRRYIENGEKQGVARAYKCRTRSPWYCVPHVYPADGFLSYMSGWMPRLVANRAEAVATNSLHVLRVLPRVSFKCEAIAAFWQTSLTRLSVEIEGHPLGGGMLKLEPTEAENVLLVVPEADNGDIRPLVSELDSLMRDGDLETAQSRADRQILEKSVGLSQTDCRLLRSAGEMLRNRRYSRSEAE